MVCWGNVINSGNDSGGHSGRDSVMDSLKDLANDSMKGFVMNFGMPSVWNILKDCVDNDFFIFYFLFFSFLACVFSLLYVLVFSFVLFLSSLFSLLSTFFSSLASPLFLHSPL